MGQTDLMYGGIHYDSDEEVWFAMWCEELRREGFIKRYKHDTVEEMKLFIGLKIPYIKKTQLKTKVKEEVKEHILLRPIVYTPDFEIAWTAKGWSKFCSPILTKPFNPNALFFGEYPEEILVELKPVFDQNNMTRDFKAKQKFIWSKEKLFINLIEDVSTLFKKTFMPALVMPYFKYSVSPSSGKNKGKKFKGDWKTDWVPKTINEYLKI